MKLSGNHTEWNIIKIIITHSHHVLSLSTIITVFSGRFIFFSNTYTRRHPEPRIPPDSRSVQFSTEFLGCWTNRIVHTSVMVRFRIHYIAQMGIVNARLIFYEWLDYKKFSLAISHHHLAICVICKVLQYSLNLCVFTNSWKHEKHENDVFHTFAK